VIVVAAAVAVLLLASMVGTMRFFRSLQVDQFIEEAQQYNRERKYEEAKAACERVSGLDPGNRDAQREWEFAETRLLEKKKERDGTEAQRKRELERAHQDAGDYMKAGLWTLALGVYERILALNPRDGIAHDGRERCEQAIKREDEDQDKRDKDYAKLLEENIQKSQLAEKQRLNRRDAFLLYEKARKSVEAALMMRLTTDGLTVRDVQKRLQEARDALQAAIRKDPTYAEALVYRGEVMHRMGEYDVAEDHYKDALTHSSDQGPAAFGASRIWCVRCYHREARDGRTSAT